AIADAAVGGVAPAVERVGEERAGVLVAGRDRGRALQADHLGRPRAVVERADTELTLVVVAPALHLAVVHHRADVMPTGGERLHAREPRNILRRTARGGVTIAELTAPIHAGAADRADAVDRAHVLATGRDHRRVHHVTQHRKRRRVVVAVAES